MSTNTVKVRIPATRDARKEAKMAKAVDQMTLPVRWVGIDKVNMPPGPTNKPTGWMGALIDNSNLRFTGAYLTGPAPQPVANYTASTKTANRHWVGNIGSLRDQGWGIVFWYVGYSVGGGEPAPAGLAAIASARGMAHAKHVKSIIRAMNPQLAGAVVFLDNEDNKYTTGNQLDPIRDYYNAFFDELEDTAEAPAMRCGLYAHSEVAAEFVRTRAELFVWEVRLDNATLVKKLNAKTGKLENTPNTNEPPFATIANPSPLFIDPVAPSRPSPLHVQSNRNIGSFPIEVSNTDRWIAWPLGRQFRYYIGDMPTAGWAVAHHDDAPLLHAVNSFDYDTSLVRDPSYPAAEPRLAAAPDQVIVAGVFVSRTVGGVDPPKMKLQSIESGGRADVVGPIAWLVEPDAPIAVAAFAGAPTWFMTVLTTGDLAAFSRDPNGVLSPVDALALTPASGLRRLRAIALVAYAADDLHLFFAGEDHQLYTSRRPSSGVWDLTSQAGSLMALHPFSSLAATSRAGQSVDVFALDTEGLLQACFWFPSSGTWQSVQLDTAVSTLLKGGALAAASPDPQKLFVFGIRSNLQLGYWEWSGPAGGWSGQTALAETTARVSPHSRLAAHSYAGVVEVAALSTDGMLRLYSLLLTGETTWTAQTPIPFDNPADEAPDDYVAPPPSSPTEEAYGWSINPYGDLAIVRETNGTVIYAAGVAPGRSGVLSLNLTIGGSTWQLVR